MSTRVLGVSSSCSTENASTPSTSYALDNSSGSNPSTTSTFIDPTFGLRYVAVFLTFKGILLNPSFEGMALYLAQTIVPSSALLEHDSAGYTTLTVLTKDTEIEQ